MRDRGRWRLSVALALALGLVAALAAPAGAASGDPDAVSRDGKQSLQLLAYFDGDTPVTGGRVRVYAGGRRLRERGDGPGPVKTFPGGIALLRFSSLPSRLRVVVSGGRAGGRPVRGSLKTKVRGVTDGEVVHVNPATTVTDVWAHAEEGRSHRRARNVIERTLGIRRILDDHDLYVTDQWFNGDRFHRWTLEQGSVGAGARALVQHIERPGFDRRVFRPRDGEGPNARAAACGGATAGTILTGLIGAADTAAGLSGPQGFAVSGVLLFVKEIINAGVSGGECGKDDVSAQLKGLRTQISQLEEKIDKQFLALRIAAVKPLVTDIGATQEKFEVAVMWAAKADNKNLPAADRDEARDSFPNSMKSFMESANDLEKRNVRNHLHDALITEQRGGTGTPMNPVEGPALIPAVRKQIGKERFFTSASSRRLRQFFSYYEWAQTELATVMTEFYMAGGPTCVTESKNCKKDSGNAKLQVNTIKANIAAQERAMPKPIDERVFIDTTTNLMWGVEPQYRSAAHIPESRIRCEAFAPLSNNCVSAVFAEFPSPNQFRTILPTSLPVAPDKVGSVSWSVPAAGQLQNLLAQRSQGEDPVAWLKNTFGVRFDEAVPGGRFPGYRPDQLTHRVSLWARDKFRMSYSRRNVFSDWNINLTAEQLLLVPCQGGRCFRHLQDLKPLDFDEVSVAHDCLEDASLRLPRLLTGRRCIAEPKTGGFILFLRDTTATERGQYW